GDARAPGRRPRLDAAVAGPPLLASIAALLALSTPYLTGNTLRRAHQALHALLLQPMASPVRSTVPALEALAPSASMAMRQRAIRSNCHAQLLPHEAQARTVPRRFAAPGKAVDAVPDVESAFQNLP